MATTTYTKDKKVKILKLITQGWSLKEISNKNPELPTFTTMGRWMKERPGFRKEYDIARKARNDANKDIVLDFVYSLISEGVTVTKILKDNQDLPRYSKLMRWIYDDPNEKEKYLAARELFAMKLMDDAIDLSVKPIDFSVGKVEMYAELNRLRLQIDTIKFTVAKAVPQIIDLKGKVEHLGISVNITNYGSGEDVKSVRVINQEPSNVIDYKEGK